MIRWTDRIRLAHCGRPPQLCLDALTCELKASKGEPRCEGSRRVGIPCSACCLFSPRFVLLLPNETLPKPQAMLGKRIRRLTRMRRTPLRTMCLNHHRLKRPEGNPAWLVYNGNGATATANVPGGSTFTLGGATYTSDPTNPITGTGQLDFVKAAPTAMFGFGNLVPESRHFSFNFEMGAVFQGSARTKLNLTGGACDATGLYCVNAATDPTVQANVAAEQNKINNKLSPFKYYPVVSFGFGYRF